MQRKSGSEPPDAVPRPATRMVSEWSVMGCIAPRTPTKPLLAAPPVSPSCDPITSLPPPLPVSTSGRFPELRFDRDVCGPYLHQLTEGRALAAVAPVDDALSVEFRACLWNLHGWGYKGGAPGFLDRPVALALAPGVADAPTDVLVCDFGNCRVQRFRMDGWLVQCWGSRGTSVGEFTFPTALAVSSAGEVFVCDAGNHRVQVFDAGGAFVRAWGTHGSLDGQLRFPFAVAVHGNLVCVSDFYNYRMQVFDVDGTFVRRWGAKGSAPGQFNQPRGVAISGGEVFVCDAGNHRMQVFALDGTYRRSWGSRGDAPGQFQEPQYVAVHAAAGHVIVSDLGAPRVQVFSVDGAYVRGVQLPTTGQLQLPFEPAGVAVTPTGNILICDRRNHRVHKDIG